MAKKQSEIIEQEAPENLTPEKGEQSFNQRAPETSMIEVDHHLFKLMAAPMKKNTSFTPGSPSIVELEHAHIFHSHDEKHGTPNARCTPVGGHTHEIKIEWGKDASGDKFPKKVVCGPAVRLTAESRGQGRAPIKKWVQIKFEDDGNDAVIVDDHVHELKYLRAERINSVKREQQRNVERAKIASTMSARPPEPVAPNP